MRTSVPLLVCLLVGTMLAATPVAFAADPSEGSVSPASPTTTWTGQAITPAQPVVTSGETDGCPPAEADPANAVCDHFIITVDVPADAYTSQAGVLKITVTFEDGDDYDVAIYRPGDDPATAPINSSASSDNPEVLTVPNPTGVYEFRAAPFTVLGPYSAVAELSFTDLSGVADPRSPGFQAYTAQRISPADLPALTDIADVDDQKDAFGDLLGGRTDGVVSNQAAAYKGNPLVFSTHDVGRSAREPTLGVDLEGNIYYAAAGFDSELNSPAMSFARTKIMRSNDGGQSFQSVSPTLGGEENTIPPISGDPYVWVDEVTGRVFSIDLQQLVNNVVLFTDDGGENWTFSVPDVTSTVTDHQTLTSGPAPAALAPLAIGPGFEGRMVYYCFNRIAESTCTRSFDGGLTFSRTGVPAYVGIDPTEADDLFLCGGLHGHITIAPDGALLLPKGHCGIPQLAISDDGGTTWRVEIIPGPGAQDTHLSVDADSAGNYYFTWFDDILKLPFLVTSTDKGVTWTDPVMIAPPGVVQVTWPTVYAGDPGRISLGYACNRSKAADQTSLSRPWDYCVTTSINALDPEPTFLSNIGNPIDDPMHRGNCPDRCGNVLDFLDTMAAVPQAGGRTYAAYTDTCTSNIFQDGSGTDFPQCNITANALGFDGDLDNASNDDRGFAVIQTCGPSVWESVGDITDSCQAAPLAEPTAVPVAAPAPAATPAPAPVASAAPAAGGAPATSGSGLPATGGGFAVLAALALAGASAAGTRRRRD